MLNTIKSHWYFYSTFLFNMNEITLASPSNIHCRINNGYYDNCNILYSHYFMSLKRTVFEINLAQLCTVSTSILESPTICYTIL